jgi:cbb3-type cytochrome oxidase maturation protein
LSILAYLIGVSLVLGSGALALFLWALRSGQYEDLDGAARRILFDGEPGDAPGEAPIAPRQNRR